MEFYKVQPAFKPIQLSLWERAYGPTFLSTEMSRLKEFYSSRFKKHVETSGFVRRTGDRQFILLPTLTTHQVYLQCSLQESAPLPEENSYIKIEGESSWSHLARARGTIFNGEREVLVRDWKPDMPDSLQIRPPIEFHEFQDEVFDRILNIEPILRDLLAFQIISCPPIERFVGGLNVCLYDATHRSFSPRVIGEIGRVIPKDLREPYILQTPIGRTTLHYRFNLVSANADEPLSERTVKVLRDRTRAGYDELSLSLGSGRTKPKSIEEPPCALSDFPTILNEDVDLSIKKADPSFDAFKYMLAMHHYMPSLANPKPVILSTHEKLVELPPKYDIPSHLLARFKFLDASFYGKTQSILRLALTDARIAERKQITVDDVNRMFQEYFLKNFDYIYEVWSDLFTETGIPIQQLLKLSPDERKIKKVVEKYQIATFNEIQQETKLKTFVLEAYLSDLVQKKGILTEAFYRTYKVIPGI